MIDKLCEGDANPLGDSDRDFMCGCNYTYAGPALLVLPLFFMSLINLFVAGPPLKTIVLDSHGSDYGASLPFLQLQVSGSTAKFNIHPAEEMTHFFVITCYAPTNKAGLQFEASVIGKRKGLPDEPLSFESTKKGTGSPQIGSGGRQDHTLQLMQPFVGFSEYGVTISSTSTSPTVSGAILPPMEYRVTYVPTRFTYTQICVRAFFTFTSLCMLVAYSYAMASASRARELGQLWMTTLLVLLVALNDPLYIARVVSGGNTHMYFVSVLGQIMFSAGLFMFWLIYADGMNSGTVSRPFCSFYVPKLVLIASYVTFACSLFLAYGRVPDRINMPETQVQDATQLHLVWGLSGSVVCVGAWLSFLVSRAVYRVHCAGSELMRWIYRATTPPRHHATTPPRHHTITPSSHHGITPLRHCITAPPRHATAPLRHRATAPPRHCATAPLRTTTPPRHCATTPPRHHATAPLHNHTTTPPRHHATAPPRHHATAPLRHCTTTPPRHHATAPLCHCATVPPPHRHRRMPYGDPPPSSPRHEPHTAISLTPPHWPHPATNATPRHHQRDPSQPSEAMRPTPLASPLWL